MTKLPLVALEGLDKLKGILDFLAKGGYTVRWLEKPLELRRGTTIALNLFLSLGSLLLSLKLIGFLKKISRD